MTLKSERFPKSQRPPIALNAFRGKKSPQKIVIPPKNSYITKPLPRTRGRSFLKRERSRPGPNAT